MMNTNCRYWSIGILATIMMVSLHYVPILSHGPINQISQFNKPGLPNGTCKRIGPPLLKSRLTAKCVAAAGDEEKKQIQLPGGLEHQLMPRHVAVIADGNKRWAKNRGLPLHHGYQVGTQVGKQLAINCSNYGVKVLSVFVFSTENWGRSQEEVDMLMNLAGEIMVPDMNELIEKENMKVSYIGNKSQLSESLQKQMLESEEHGMSNTGMHTMIAFNYSGQYDIVEASRKIATKVKDGVLRVEDIDPTLFEQHLVTNVAQFPNPDLLIRTSGELRISNFMLWQLAYTEMCFMDKMFPDLDETDLVQALAEFQRRQRRFGGHKY